MSLSVRGRIRVRLHGIDAPERKQAGGDKSTKAMTALALNKRVALEPINQDRYDRLVAIVSVNGQSVKRRTVEEGCAWGLSAAV